MLVLKMTRGKKIFIGDKIILTYHGNGSIGIDVPESIEITREGMVKGKKEENGNARASNHM